MGSNKGHNQANDMTRNQVNAASNFQNEMTNGLANSQRRSDQTYDALYSGYKNLASGGGAYNPAVSAGGGGGGGYSAPATPGNIGKFYKEMGETGGWSPERSASMQGNINSAQGIRDTGGYDAASMDKIRGSGVYQGMINNGGYSDRNLAAMRGQASAAIPSMYNNMRSQMGRANQAQGGYGFGFGGSLSKLGRDQGRAASEAGLNSELGIANAVREGKMQGAQAMSGAEQGLQTNRISNMLQGGNQAANQEMNLVQDINTNRKYGIGQQAAEAQRQQAAAANANAQASADAMRQWQMNSGLQLQGLEGLAGLRGQAPGETGQYIQGGLGGLNAGQGASGQYQQNNPYQNVGANIMSGIGGIAGAVAPALMGNPMGAMQGLGNLAGGGIMGPQKPQMQKGGW